MYVLAGGRQRSVSGVIPQESYTLWFQWDLSPTDVAELASQPASEILLFWDNRHIPHIQHLSGSWEVLVGFLFSFFLSAWHKLVLPRKMILHWENASVSLHVCRISSWLMTGVGETAPPLGRGLGMFRKSGWANYKKHPVSSFLHGLCFRGCLAYKRQSMMKGS